MANRKFSSKSSGVRAIFRPETPSIAAVLCVSGALAKRLQERFPERQDLIVASTKAERGAAREAVDAAALFAFSAGSAFEPHAEVRDALEAWPLVQLLWFEQWLRPELDADEDARMRRVELAGPFRRDLDGLEEFLAARIEGGLERRRRQLATGRALASVHGLPELATKLLTGVALRMPRPRLRALVGQSEGRFRNYLSDQIYRRLGVNSLAEVQLLLGTLEAGLADVSDR